MVQGLQEQSSRPFAPRRGSEARKTSRAFGQSGSIIVVDIADSKSVGIP
ncbi:hypothetical protein ACFW16_23570 [Inquilinus sp. NPDC058860]